MLCRWLEGRGCSGLTCRMGEGRSISWEDAGGGGGVGGAGAVERQT